MWWINTFRGSLDANPPRRPTDLKSLSHGSRLIAGAHARPSRQFCRCEVPVDRAAAGPWANHNKFRSIEPERANPTFAPRAKKPQLGSVLSRCRVNAFHDVALNCAPAHLIRRGAAHLWHGSARHDLRDSTRIGRILSPERLGMLIQGKVLKKT